MREIFRFPIAQWKKKKKYIAIRISNLIAMEFIIMYVPHAHNVNLFFTMSICMKCVSVKNKKKKKTKYLKQKETSSHMSSYKHENVKNLQRKREMWKKNLRQNQV